MLACIDVENEESTLMGKEVFDLDERQIVEMMVKNGYVEQDVDEEDWGERRVSFPEGNIDFFMVEDELVSIVMGA